MVIRLRNNHFSGGKVGIKTSGPVQLDVEGNTFENVEQPCCRANKALAVAAREAGLEVLAYILEIAALEAEQDPRKERQRKIIA